MFIVVHETGGFYTPYGKEPHSMDNVPVRYYSLETAEKVAEMLTRLAGRGKYMAREFASINPAVAS